MMKQPPLARFPNLLRKLRLTLPRLLPYLRTRLQRTRRNLLHCQLRNRLRGQLLSLLLPQRPLQIQLRKVLLSRDQC